MDFKNVERLIELFSEHGLTKLEYKEDNKRITLEKGSVSVVEPMVSQPVVQNTNPVKPIAEDAPKIVEPENNNHFVKAPLVGVFYEASSPGANPYVKVGDRVEVGQVLCIIEAMKMINEIKSDVSGKIVNILQKNGDLLEFDSPIFEIEV